MHSKRRDIIGEAPVSAIPKSHFSTRDDPGDPEHAPWGVVSDPFSFLVVGNFIQRPDPRPLEGRRPILMTLDKFDVIMTGQKLAVALQLPEQSEPTVLRFRTLSDFEPAALVAQLTSLTMLQGQRLEAAVRLAFETPAVRQLESLWHGLKWLLERVAGRVPVELVSCSIVDLLMDFEDTSEMRKSGLWRLTHQYNHLGFRSNGAIVLLGDIEPHGDCSTLDVLHNVAEVAASSHLVVLAEATMPAELPDLPPERAAADALRFLALCAPPVRARAAIDGRGELAISAAFVAAALLVESIAATGGCWHYASQSLPGSLAETTVDTSGRRYLLLENHGGRITVARDASWRVGEEPPLSDVLLAAHIKREALNVQYRRVLRESVPIDELLATMNEGLSARLGHLDWLQAHLDSPREIDGWPYWLEVTLHLQLIDEAGRRHTIAEPFRINRVYGAG